jgi:hypothetical protein
MESWFYIRNGVREGPVTLEQLKGLLSTGSISPETNVWRNGLSGWMPARQTPELAGAFPNVPQPPAMPPAVPEPPRVPAPRLSLGLRIMTLIAAILVIAAFFSPYFYVKATTRTPERIGESEAPESVRVLDGLYADAWPMGWSYWFAIVAFSLGCAALVASVLDLCMQRSRVMRAIDKWLMFAAFIGIFTLSATYLTLGLCGIGIGGSLLTASDPVKLEFEQSTLGELQAQRDKDHKAGLKQIQQLPDDIKPTKAERIKALNEIRIEVKCIPVAAIAPVVGGALGLIGVLVIMKSKK